MTLDAGQTSEMLTINIRGDWEPESYEGFIVSDDLVTTFTIAAPSAGAITVSLRTRNGDILLFSLTRMLTKT